ncbi:MAG TPA: hypothetical protein VG759_14635 [Candidatus Angelobacter sp.]|nr:hypothetical protein [Candidatus Angelobacter sp.]
MFSAFTVAELREMLPPLTNYRLWQQRSTDDLTLLGKQSITNYSIKDDKYDELIAETEADARAKMLVYLLEKKLV